jgi:hypothetical protein
MNNLYKTNLIRSYVYSMHGHVRVGLNEPFNGFNEVRDLDELMMCPNRVRRINRLTILRRKLYDLASCE